MKYIMVISIIGCLCNSLANANYDSVKIFNLKPTRSLIYHLSVHFLKSCDLNLKRMIVYNNVSDQNFFSAIAEIQPQTSVLLLSNVIAWQQVARYRFDDIKVDAVVVVIDVTIPWVLFNDLFRIWPFNRDCIVYIVPVPLHACAEHGLILELIMRFYFSAAYFICQMNGRFTRVYTHDLYGDSGPPHWIKTFQDIYWGKNWTIYERSYRKDMSELCPGFYFKRTDPTDKIFPIIGVHIDHISTDYEETRERLVNDDELEPFLDTSLSNEVRNLKRLLQVNFKYYTIILPRLEDTLGFAYSLSSIDALLFPRFSVFHDSWWNNFYSVRIEPYAILSHYQGFMTPFEKIAKFYGMWTLSSLIVMLSMTSIVIWLKTNKVSSAAFDAIRLLINTGIMVPINTPALKIYFSMVFLYFLIIHATFSGHLPEFLTSYEYKPNVETLEDLKDPRIEKIYHFGYEIPESEELDDLRQKSESIWMSFDCLRIQNEPNSACIAPLSNVREAWIDMNSDMTDDDIYYIGKNTFGLSLASQVYRPGFPLREKFNWAVMYLFDTGIGIDVSDTNLLSDFQLFNKVAAAEFIEYRNITISDLYFAFVFLIGGYCAAFFCFLLERGFKLMSNKKKNHRMNEKDVSIAVEPRRSL